MQDRAEFNRVNKPLVEQYLQETTTLSGQAFANATIDILRAIWTIPSSRKFTQKLYAQNFLAWKAKNGAK